MWPKWRTLKEEWPAVLLIRLDSLVLTALKWAWLIGLGQKLLRKVLPYVFLALSRPSCHCKCSLKSSYRSWLQKLETFPGSLYRAITSYLSRLQFSGFGHILGGFFHFFKELANGENIKSRVLCLTLGRFSMIITALAVDWCCDEIPMSRNNHFLIDGWQVYYAHRIYKRGLLETSTYPEFQSYSRKDEWVKGTKGKLCIVNVQF